jgi:hypothetical protein
MNYTASIAPVELPQNVLMSFIGGLRNRTIESFVFDFHFAVVSE